MPVWILNGHISFLWSTCYLRGRDHIQRGFFDLHMAARVHQSSGSRVRRKAQEARNATLRRLARPLKRELPHQMPIASMDLQPLIDLAYWSTFVEVRRDAAAAFVALSSEEDNLHNLSRGGALGALLALMGAAGQGAQGGLDPECRRDAALAVARLCKLDDVKERLLSSPHGLETVLEMVCDEDQRVKRAALQIVERLCSLRDTCVAVVEELGLRDLAPQLNAGDHAVRLRAAHVLLNVAHQGLPPRLLYDPVVVRNVLDCLAEDFAPRCGWTIWATRRDGGRVGKI